MRSICCSYLLTSMTHCVFLSSMDSDPTQVDINFAAIVSTACHACLFKLRSLLHTNPTCESLLLQRTPILWAERLLKQFTRSSIIQIPKGRSKRVKRRPSKSTYVYRPHTKTGLCDDHGRRHASNANLQSLPYRHSCCPHLELSPNRAPHTLSPQADDPPNGLKSRS